MQSRIGAITGERATPLLYILLVQSCIPRRKAFPVAKRSGPDPASAPDPEMKARVRQSCAARVLRSQPPNYAHTLHPISRRSEVLCQAATVSPAEQISGLPEFLDGLKYNDQGLVAVIVQVRTCQSYLNSVFRMSDVTGLSSQYSVMTRWQRYRTWTRARSPCKRLQTRLLFQKHCRLALQHSTRDPARGGGARVRPVATSSR